MVTDGVADIYMAYLFDCGSLRHAYTTCRRPIGVLPIQNRYSNVAAILKGVSLVDNDGSTNVIVLLRKALYGLRQSPKLLNKLLDELLNSCGLRRCVHEACIYKYFGADSWVLIGAEVDDLIVTGTNIKKAAELQTLFQDKWGVEKCGGAHTFLGMRCKYGRAAGELTLDNAP